MKQLSLQRKHKEALVQIAEGRQQGLDLDVIKELTAAGFLSPSGILTQQGRTMATSLIAGKRSREERDKGLMK